MYIDMHCHSVSSDDSRATVEGYLKWIQVLRKRGYQIDSIVLTEHRKYDRDADYSALARQYDVLVLKGSELDTTCGHFLVYGVNEGLLRAVDFTNVRIEPNELIAEARHHGALAIPAHPGRKGIGLCQYIAEGREFDGLGIVETLNGGSRRGENELSEELAQSRGYSGIAGSDAHLVSNIGTCVTYFPQPVRNEAELVEALHAGHFSPLWLEETRNGHGPAAGHQL